MVAMLLGMAAIFYFTMRGGNSFTVTPSDGTSIRVHADLGNGIASRGARAEWDFDGDGKADATGPDATWSYGAPGTYAVVLTVTDLFGKTDVQRRSVVVGEK